MIHPWIRSALGQLPDRVVCDPPKAICPLPRLRLVTHLPRSCRCPRPQIFYLYPDSLRKRKYLAKSFRKDSCCRHDLRGIFEHDGTGRADRVGRNGLVEHRLARRARLDQGMSCSDVGAALFLETTRFAWFRLYSEEGTEGLAGFGYEGRDGHLKARQRDQLKSWIAETLPRTTRHVGAWIEQEFGIVYQSRSGLVTLLHRLGMEHRKPQAVSQKLDVVKQKAFRSASDSIRISQHRTRGC